MLESPPIPTTRATLLEMRNITKRFPGVLANDQVNLTLRAGKVHALLGENGAGKTTLINILYGLYSPDEGEIWMRGESVHFHSPKDAIHAGLGLIAQHFMLVRKHTVAENIALGMERSPFFFPLRQLKAQIRELGERYGLGVDPDAYVGELSAGEQQRVEILKALVRGAKVLIMDEPTGVLTPQEVRGLFEVLARMKAEGHAVIFITHKLGEVLEIAEHITVLRKGAVVGSLSRENADEKALARLMVGREVAPVRLERQGNEVRGMVLSAENLTAQSERGHAALKRISFEVKRGEILGVAGVAGNGQSELLEAVTGYRALEKGRLTFAGHDITALSARERFERGVAYIPEERNRVGVVPTLSVAENLSLRHYRYAPFSQGPLLRPGAVSTFAQGAIQTYDIATPSQKTPTRLLSGGNIQKLILARELANLSERSHDAPLIVASHPTYGLDVGAAAQVHRALLEERKKGAGVLLVSEDLEELLGLSDRIMVMFAGEVMGIFEGEGADREQLGLMMAGVKA